MAKGDDFKELFDELIETDEEFNGAIESLDKVIEYKGRIIKLSVSFEEN